MKFGMNLLLWSGELTDAILPVLEKLKARSAAIKTLKILSSTIAAQKIVSREAGKYRLHIYQLF